MSDDRKLDCWTVYDHPSDYPNDWVARKFVVEAGVVSRTDDVLTSRALRRLHKKLPAGLHRLNRHPQDDPKIVEVLI